MFSVLNFENLVKFCLKCSAEEQDVEKVQEVSKEEGSDQWVLGLFHGRNFEKFTLYIFVYSRVTS